MPSSGELIRLQNYVDDIQTTLRRISANISSIGEDERKRLAEYMRKSESNYTTLLERLEKGQ